MHSMRLQFLGAARQVTGSQYYFQANGAKVLIDCGMFQEREFLERNWNPCPVRPRDIDAVLLTHAHIDHCGLLPKLVQEGFRGPVLATAASVDLVGLVLRDSAADPGGRRGRSRRSGTARKAAAANTPKSRSTRWPTSSARCRFSSPCPTTGRAVSGGLSATFHDAGHILGSAMIELEAAGGRPLAAADLQRRHGPARQALRPQPAHASPQADYIVMESTYGDRIAREPRQHRGRNWPR